MGSQYTISQNKNLSVLSTRPDKNETFAITADGDISFGDAGRSPVFVSGIEKLKQDVLIIIKSLKGSSKFRADLGLDVFAIVESEYDPIVIAAEVEEAISKHPDVVALKDMKVLKTSTQAVATEDIRQHYFIEFFVECNDNQSFFMSASI